MPRTESYLIRLTKPEKDELARRAREQGISIAKLIRQRLRLDAEKGATPPLAALVAKNKLRYPTATAERMARKELE